MDTGLPKGVCFHISKKKIEELQAVVVNAMVGKISTAISVFNDILSAHLNRLVTENSILMLYFTGVKLNLNLGSSSWDSCSWRTWYAKKLLLVLAQNLFLKLNGYYDFRDIVRTG